jgi:hypothetical protein
MADMVPRDPGQQAWMEARLARLHGVRQIWPTAWELDGDAARARVLSVLRTEAPQTVVAETGGP